MQQFPQKVILDWRQPPLEKSCRKTSLRCLQVLLHGEGDPYVPLEKGQELASSLSVPMMLIPRGGHLNEESGFVSFPFLFEKIHHLLK